MALAACGALAAAIAMAVVPGSERWLDELACAAGFRLARIEVAGIRYTQRADIVAALSAETGMPITRVEPLAAKRRIEALPWVATADVRRMLPDAVAVTVVERKPAILWRGPDRDVMLDMTGRELSTVPRGAELGLPVVSGAAAGTAAPDLLSLLGSYPQVLTRMAEARLVDGRRWSLVLDSGTEVHLPADGLAAALAWLDGPAGRGLLGGGLEAVDLRVAGQLVVRGHASGRPAGEAATHKTARAAAAGGTP